MLNKIMVLVLAAALLAAWTAAEVAVAPWPTLALADDDDDDDDRGDDDDDDDDDRRRLCSVR